MKAILDVDIVRNQQDLNRLSGQRAEMVGRYCAVERPIKGIVRKPRPKDHAMLVLQDDVHVYLEPFESPASERPAGELREFDGKLVRITGIAYQRMPAMGQSPLAPCIAEIAEVREDHETGDANRIGGRP